MSDRCNEQIIFSNGVDKDDDGEDDQQANADYVNFDGTFRDYLQEGANNNNTNEDNNNNNNNNDNINNVMMTTTSAANFNSAGMSMTFDDDDFNDDDFDDDGHDTAASPRAVKKKSGANVQFNLTRQGSGPTPSIIVTEHSNAAYEGSRCGPLFHAFWKMRDDPRQRYNVVSELARTELDSTKIDFAEKLTAQQGFAPYFSGSGDSSERRRSIIDQILASSTTAAGDGLKQQLERIVFQQARVDRLHRLVNIDRASKEPNADLDILLPLPVLGGGKYQQQHQPSSVAMETSSNAVTAENVDEIVRLYKESQSGSRPRLDHPPLGAVRSPRHSNFDNSSSSCASSSSSASLPPHYKPHQANGIRFLWETLVVPLESTSTITTSNAVSASTTSEKIQSAGCIVAQSMGLGKTFQALSFINLLLRFVKRDAKILIVVPRSVVISWLGELELWKEHLETLGTVNVFDLSQETCVQEQFSLRRTTAAAAAAADTAQQQQQQQQQQQPEVLHVIQRWLKDGGIAFVGYEKLRSFYLLFKKAMQQQEQLKPGFILNPVATNNSSESAAAGSKKKGTSSTKAQLSEQVTSAGAVALFSHVLDLVVCDEAHRLRNHKTLEVEAVRKLPSRRRLALTGTPIQNRLLDYFSMVDFALPGYFDRRRFITFFQQPIDASARKDADPATISKARKRMFTLAKEIERFVQRVDPLVLQRQLPPITEIVFMVPLSPKQMTLYEEFRNHVLKTRGQGASNAGIFRFVNATSRIGVHPVMHRKIMLNTIQDQNPLNNPRPTTAAAAAANSRIRQRESQQQKNRHDDDDHDHDDHDFVNPNNRVMVATTTAKGGVGGTSHTSKHNNYNNYNNNNERAAIVPASTIDEEAAIDLELADMDDFDDVGDILKEEKKERKKKGASAAAAAAATPVDQQQKNSKAKTAPNTTAAAAAVGSSFALDYDKKHWPTAVRAELQKNDFFKDSPRLELFLRLLRQTIENDECALVFSHSTKVLDLVESALDALAETEWKVKEFKQRVRIDGSTSLKTRMKAVTGFQQQHNDDGESKKPSPKGGKSGSKKKATTAAMATKTTTKTNRKNQPLSHDSLVPCVEEKNDEYDDDEVELIPDFASPNNDKNTNNNHNVNEGNSAGDEDDDEANDFDFDDNYDFGGGGGDDDDDDALPIDQVQTQLCSQEQRIRDEAPRIFILSTKAGGVGLTLHRASRVFLLDNGWNPADERQAIGRAYRFGQTRPVFVYRFVAFGTFETDIFNVKLSKEWLFSTVVDSESVKRENIFGFQTSKVLQRPVMPTPAWKDIPEGSKNETVRCASIDDAVLGKVITDVCKLHIRGLDNNNSNKNKNRSDDTQQRTQQQLLQHERASRHLPSTPTATATTALAMAREPLPTIVLARQSIVLGAMRWTSLLAGDEEELYGEAEQQYYLTFVENGGLGSSTMFTENGDEASPAAAENSANGFDGGKVASLRDVHRRVGETSRAGNILLDVINSELAKRQQLAAAAVAGTGGGTGSGFTFQKTLQAVNLMQNGAAILEGSAAANNGTIPTMASLQQKRVFDPTRRNALAFQNVSQQQQQQQQRKDKQTPSSSNTTKDVIINLDDDDADEVEAVSKQNRRKTRPGAAPAPRAPADAAIETVICDSDLDDDHNNNNNNNNNNNPDNISLLPQVQRQQQQQVQQSNSTRTTAQSTHGSWTVTNADEAIRMLQEDHFFGTEEEDE